MTDKSTSGQEVPLSEVLTGLGIILATATSLMVYLGWRRNFELSTRLGYHQSLLNFTTQDLIIRSAPAVLDQVLGLAALAILALASYALLCFARTQARWARTVNRLVWTIRLITLMIVGILAIEWMFGFRIAGDIAGLNLVVTAVLFLMCELIGHAPAATENSRRPSAWLEFH